MNNIHIIDEIDKFGDELWDSINVGDVSNIQQLSKVFNFLGDLISMLARPNVISGYEAEPSRN